jgi:hypothetical protein
VDQRYGENLVAGLPESPAAERNKQAILEVLERWLPPSGTVLEIASGTGQHVVHFARALPELVWQPTDADADLRAAAATRVASASLANVLAPLPLEVLDDNTWPVSSPAAIVCINMIHIAPSAATPGLFRGAARLLGARSPLVLYGPFRRGGRHTAPSNEAFDASLKARNADWGVRNLEDVEDVARSHGFALVETAPMPANNLTVVFERLE